MVDRDAFGLPVPSEEEDDEFAFLKDPAPETPAPETTAPEAPSEEPAPEAEPTEEPAEETPEEKRLYAKRYETLEAFEDGYQNLRELHRRTAERAKEYEQQNETLMRHAQEVEATLQRAVYALQQQQYQQPQPQQIQYDDYGNPVQQPQQGPSPAQVQAYIDQQIQMQANAARQDAMEQARADAQADAARRSIGAFYEKHPEVEVEGAVDDDIARTIHALDDAWQPYGSSVDISDPDSLEIAYEAMQRPALRSVLEKNPALFDDDQGMQLARFQASILEGQPITQSAQTVPASSPNAQVVGSSRPPVVERAATSNSANDDKPLDEVDQAFLEYRRFKTRSGDSVFFGAPATFVE